MSSNPQAFMSSASFMLTKSGSYITDITSAGHRAGGKGHHQTTDILSDLECEPNVSDSNRKSRHLVTECNGAGTRAAISGCGEPATIDHEGLTQIKESSAEDAENVKLKFSQMTHRSKYTLVMLAVANFGAGCAYSLPAPFFPREATKKGASSTVIGLVFSCFQLIIFIASPFFGNFITHIGAKFTYVSGIMVAGVCAILFGFLDKGPSGDSFIAMAFILRSVEGIGVAAFSTASLAIVSNEFPNHIGSVFATLETCVGIGLLIGPTMGGALYEVGGFGMPFWIIGVVICSSALTIMTCLPQPQDNKKQKKGSVFSLLKSLLVWVTGLNIFAGALGISYLDPTLSDHLDQFGLSTLLVGLFFAIVPGLYALVAPFWGYFSDRKDIQSPLLIVGSSISAVGFLLVGPTPLLPFLPKDLWLVSVGLLLFGLTLGCSIVPTMKCLVNGARELGFPDGLSTFGLVSGLFSATFSLGAFVGPSIGGALVEKIGFAYGCTIVAGFFFFVTMVTSVYFGTRCVRTTGSLSITQRNVSRSQTETPSSVEESEITEKSPLLKDEGHLVDRVIIESSFSSASYSHIKVLKK